MCLFTNLYIFGVYLQKDGVHVNTETAEPIYKSIYLWGVYLQKNGTNWL